MARLQYQKVCYGPQLYNEIVAAIPALSPVAAGQGAPPLSLVIIEVDSSSTWVTVPDTTLQRDIDTVVGKHIANPPVFVTRQQWKDTMRAQISKGATVAEVRAALMVLLDGV